MLKKCGLTLCVLGWFRINNGYWMIFINFRQIKLELKKYDDSINYFGPS